MGKTKTLFENISCGAFILRDEYFGLSASGVGNIAVWIAAFLSLYSGVEYTKKFIKNRNELFKNKN